MWAPQRCQHQSGAQLPAPHRCKHRLGAGVLHRFGASTARFTASWPKTGALPALNRTKGVTNYRKDERQKLPLLFHEKIRSFLFLLIVSGRDDKHNVGAISSECLYRYVIYCVHCTLYNANHDPRNLPLRFNRFIVFQYYVADPMVMNNRGKNHQVTNYRDFTVIEFFKLKLTILRVHKVSESKIFSDLL